MSYTYNNEIRYSDSVDLDAFGRLRTSQITSLLEFKHVHDLLPLVIDQVVSGAGATASFDFPNSQVVMTVTGSNDYVIRQSKSRGIYQPGKGQLVEASFGRFDLETDVIKRVGYFQGATAAPYNSGFDGFFIESNGSTGLISFQVWHAGTNVVNSPSGSWLSTDYDANLLDWSKVQLLVIDYQWLGVGRIRFGLVIDGVTKVFFTRSSVNIDTTVYMKEPNQPIRYEIRSVGGAGTLNMICSQVSMEGSINNLQKSVFLNGFSSVNLALSSSKYPLIGYRVNSGYDGANLTLADVQTINVTNSGKASYLVTVEFNPVLSATPAYTNIPNTPVDVAIGNGSQTVTTSGYQLAGFLGSENQVQVDTFEFENNLLRPGFNVNGSQDQIWICIQASSNNQDFRTGANISYYD